MNCLRIHAKDNVAVALETLPAGTEVSLPDISFRTAEEIPAGHKAALFPVRKGEVLIKYGAPIARATADIAPGCHVHTHNAATLLSPDTELSWQYTDCALPPLEPLSFQGYLRDKGEAAVRNELWVLPLVGCVNGICSQLVSANRHLVRGTVEGLHTFAHPFGCSQLGGDLSRTAKLLAALARHPNAGGVLIVGLGCENLTLSLFKETLGDYDPARIRFLLCQEESDELAAGSRLLASLAEYASAFQRRTLPASSLVVGLKCGGSDGLSGITANPVVGGFSDRLVAMGGTTLLTEVPEMFGAEQQLFARCRTKEVFDQAEGMIREFKQYFLDHGQPVYENPSPGNKAGGITTLEEKSLGCIQKGGSAPVSGVLAYAERVREKGLHLLYGPGNDLVSSTALTAAGAHLILFTTGRGTPFGAPAPTVKISTNSALARKKSNWIDFDAGTVATGEESTAQAADRLLSFVMDVAGGEKTGTERTGCREIAVFHDGVTL